MGTDSIKKYKDCATVTELCIFEENYEYVLIYQAKMKAAGIKRTNLPEVINAIIAELRQQ